jgi:putative ABC transport system substrate-binding protein
MRRREFIGLLGGAAAWPLRARAQQQDRIARIGYLYPLPPDGAVYDEFRAGLRDLGYVEGKNLRIESRYSEGHSDRLPGLTAELIDLKVDVIVTSGEGLYAAARITKTVPIVMAAAADVVAMGLVASLAHPGGNITGETILVPELIAKRLEFLKQAVPSMTRAGLLMPRDSPATGNALSVISGAAKALKVELRPVMVSDAGEIESAIARAVDEQIGGLVLTDGVPFIGLVAEIAAIAQRLRLASSGGPGFAASGGLIGYGVYFRPMFRHAATFVDKILKGAKPGDIPIEQPTKFKTLINLKTAKALGIEIPTTLLASADEVIE